MTAARQGNNTFDFAIFQPSACNDESVHSYRPGGLPVVDIGDKFCDNVYTILHKLGYGDSSTVWLAQDMNTQQYVALKMLTAEVSSLGSQLKIQKYLSQEDRSPLHARIAKILRSFEFESPNGQHTCLVFEFMGPHLQSMLGDFKIKPEYARKLSRDIADTIKLLHSKAIAFGDLSTANILLRFKDLSQKDSADLIEDLGGKAETEPLHAIEGREVYRSHGPSNLYGSYDCRDIDLDLLIPAVALTDLNEAVLLNDQTTDTDIVSAVNMYIAAPEHIFGINQRHTKQSDIWSLACCFFEIRASRPLFNTSQADSVGHEIIGLLGSPPSQWVNLITDSPNHPGRHTLPTITQPQHTEQATLVSKIQGIGAWRPWVIMTWEERRKYYLDLVGRDFDDDPNNQYKLRDYPPPPAKLSDEEFEDFHDLLSKMLRYVPEERITIDEVLAHPWLNKNYNDLDEPTEWISGYSQGHDVSMDGPIQSLEPGSHNLGEPLPVSSKQQINEYQPVVVDESEEFSVTKLLGLPTFLCIEEEVSIRSTSDDTLELSEVDKCSDPAAQENETISSLTRSRGNSKSNQESVPQLGALRNHGAINTQPLSANTSEENPSIGSNSLNFEDGYQSDSSSEGTCGHSVISPTDTSISNASNEITRTSASWQNEPASAKSGSLRGGGTTEMLKTKNENEEEEEKGEEGEASTIEQEKASQSSLADVKVVNYEVPWWHGAICIGVVVLVFGIQRGLRSVYEERKS